jgi:hypothetical protein
MMPHQNAGGPAFPMHVKMGGGGGDLTHYGMSLRDWFAGQALAGMLAGHRDASGDWTAFATDAFAAADAMLAHCQPQTPIIQNFGRHEPSTN